MTRKAERCLRIAPHVGTPGQLAFPFPSSRRVVALDMSTATGCDFARFLRERRPSKLVETRKVPSFSAASMSRRSAFDMFRMYNVTYLDPGFACPGETALRMVIEAASDRGLIGVLVDDWSPSFWDVMNRSLPEGWTVEPAK